MMFTLNTSAVQPKGPRAESRSRILVVDDDYFFADLVEDLLSEDCDVIYASNASMALEIASQKQPNVILLDVMMPEIHGYEVCRRLKAHRQTRNIPVIFLTSLGEASSQKIGLGLGAAGYVTKPFDPPKLKVLINSQIKQKRAMDKQHRLRRAGTMTLDLIRFWRQGSLR
jgi:putative two-component system response regulator